MPNAATPSTGSAAFARHKSAQEAAPDDGPRGPSMSLLARFLIFVFVPSFTGLTGLGISYLQSLRQTEVEEGEEPHAVDFDRDFVTPFLLSMAFVIVLGFQTNGFAPGSQENRRGAFVWPKARRVQRVRRERVIVDDEDDGAKKEQ